MGVTYRYADADVKFVGSLQCLVDDLSSLEKGKHDLVLRRSSFLIARLFGRLRALITAFVSFHYKMTFATIADKRIFIPYQRKKIVLKEPIESVLASPQPGLRAADFVAGAYGRRLLQGAMLAARLLISRAHGLRDTCCYPAANDNLIEFVDRTASSTIALRSIDALVQGS
jgi:hypothetical protein